jgi:hypothetical protein
MSPEKARIDGLNEVKTNVEKKRIEKRRLLLRLVTITGLSLGIST